VVAGTLDTSTERSASVEVVDFSAEGLTCESVQSTPNAVDNPAGHYLGEVGGPTVCGGGYNGVTVR